ncbi:hypothetical protein [Leisingera sp. S232]|uniref:hypothetical protein n=1 Tax=Leisingera sp. S232 TaxID=3415132 RepID=UPI003C7CFD42
MTDFLAHVLEINGISDPAEYLEEREADTEIAEHDSVDLQTTGSVVLAAGNIGTPEYYKAKEEALSLL